MSETTNNIIEINYIKTNMIYVLLSEYHFPNVNVLFEADLSYNNLISSSNVSFEGGNHNSELIYNNNNKFRWNKTYNYDDYINNIITSETYTINFFDSSNNISNSSTKTIYILRFEYYLSIPLNLNNYVTNNGSYYGIDSLNLDISNNNISCYLPSNSKTITISDIIIDDLSENIVYDVLLNLNIDSSGIIMSNVDISGQSHTKYIETDGNLSIVKFLSWPTENISIDYDNLNKITDKLHATITPALVKNYFSNKITTIENHYSGSILNSLNIDISNIEPSENNILQLFSNNNNYFDTDTNTHIFDAGDVIVFELNNNYKIDIIDKNNITQNIIPETKVFIFIKQT